VSSELQKTVEAEAVCRRCGFKWRTAAVVLPFLSAPMVPGICPVCDRGLEAERKATAERTRQAREKARQEQREKAWAKLCPQEYRLTTETDGKTEIARLELLVPKLKEILAWQYGSRGLIIRSRASGRGKTRSAWRLLRKQWLEERTIAFHTAGGFKRKVQDAAQVFHLDAWFKQLAAVDILYIDDLGKGDWTQLTEAFWFDLVETRTSHCRPIILTTNYKGEELEDRSRGDIPEFTIRRLREFCDVITLD
jgi:DNA replication protein DnaC